MNKRRVFFGDAFYFFLTSLILNVASQILGHWINGNASNWAQDEMRHELDPITVKSPMVYRSSMVNIWIMVMTGTHVLMAIVGIILTHLSK